MNMESKTAYYHLPGCSSFTSCIACFCRCTVSTGNISTTGAPSARSTARRRTASGAAAASAPANGRAQEALALTREYGISARLTFSNSLLPPGAPFRPAAATRSAVLFARMRRPAERRHRPLGPAAGLSESAITRSSIFVSSTTKVLTELPPAPAGAGTGGAFRYVVPDFRLNKAFDELARPAAAAQGQDGIPLQRVLLVRLPGADARCYEAVSRKNLGEPARSTAAPPPARPRATAFPSAMENPGFHRRRRDIRNVYLPMGFSNFKIEGRGLGSATGAGISALLHDKTRVSDETSARRFIWIICWIYFRKQVSHVRTRQSKIRGNPESAASCFRKAPAHDHARPGGAVRALCCSALTGYHSAIEETGRQIETRFEKPPHEPEEDEWQPE